MPFQLKAFLNHLADEIEKDAPAVLSLLRTVGLAIPGAVGEGIELGAGILGEVTAPTPPATAAAAQPSVVTAAATSSLVDEHGGAVLAPPK